MLSQSSSPPGADRLSSLNDDLLHHILSFLRDTRACARTSVLSSRFRSLWINHPSIHLTHPDALIPRTADRFVDCVDRCLASHNLSLLRSLDLDLDSTRSANPRSANRWLRLVSSRSHSLSSLRLSAHNHYSKLINVPRTVFTKCHNLVSLKLDYLSVPSWIVSSTSFPGFLTLTTLHLIWCKNFDDRTLSSLLSKCPSLRSLTLKWCCQLTSIRLFSTKLHMLHIKYCCIRTLCQVWIEDAPYLTSLKFCGDVNNLYFNNTPLLVDVDISHYSRYTFEQWMRPITRITFDQWMRPITCISHAPTKTLCVSGWFFDFLLPRAGMPHAPLFRNLRMLDCHVRLLTAPMLHGLASMLGHCLNLEHLNIDLSRRRRGKSHCREDENREGLDCLEVVEEDEDCWDHSKVMEENEDVAPNLKTITVRNFIGTPNEMKMLEYLLAKASILEKLHIQHFMRRSTEELSRLLSSIPRASPHMQISEL